MKIFYSVLIKALLFVLSARFERCPHAYITYTALIGSLRFTLLSDSSQTMSDGIRSVIVEARSDALCFLLKPP